jgi:ABC-type multidrug transport system fused ATPase/permease subunit
MEQYNTTEQRETCLLEHSIHLVHIDLFLYYFSVLLLSLFVLEVLLSFYAFGWKHCKNPFYFLDPIIVFASFILEIYFHYGNIGRAGRATSALILLRLWKIIRATHAVAHSIALKNRALIEKIQEAKILLEEEKNQAEQTLEKQEIKVEYLVNLLTRLGKLPSTKQIDNYVNNISTQKQKQT